MIIPVRGEGGLSRCCSRRDGRRRQTWEVLRRFRQMELSDHVDLRGVRRERKESGQLPGLI